MDPHAAAAPSSARCIQGLEGEGQGLPALSGSRLHQSLPLVLLCHSWLTSKPMGNHGWQRQVTALPPSLSAPAPAGTSPPQSSRPCSGSWAGIGGFFLLGAADLCQLPSSYQPPCRNNLLTLRNSLRLSHTHIPPHTLYVVQNDPMLQKPTSSQGSPVLLSFT